VATERKSLARRAKDILFLHGTILVYTGTTVLAKVASGHPFLSAGYVLACTRCCGSRSSSGSARRWPTPTRA